MEMLLLIAVINFGTLAFLLLTGSKRNIESRTEREEKILREANSKKGEQ